MEHLRLLFAICILILCRTEVCQSNACPTHDKDSLLQPHHEYTYYLKSETVEGERRECMVEVSHSSECFYTLQLSNCNSSIEHDDPSSLSRYPILFSLSEGNVPFMFTHEDDPIRILNIKRAVLSSFILKASYFTSSDTQQKMQTDVHGVCPLTVIPLDRERVRVIKDVSQCVPPGHSVERPSVSSLFWDKISVGHAFNSTTDCEHRVDTSEKKIVSVHCRETHVGGSLHISILHTMKLMRAAPRAEKVYQPELKLKKSVLFEFESIIQPCQSEGITMLSQLVRDSAEEMKLSTLSLFTDFVAWMESCTDLRPILDSVLSCSNMPGEECSPHEKALGMSYLSDALLHCSTEECLDSLNLLMRKGEISSTYMNYVFYLWSKIREASLPTLRSILTTCKETSLSLCWMTLGTMIRHTHHHGTHKEYLTNIATYLTDAIDSFCVPESEHIEDLTRYLKVINNMGDALLTLKPDGLEKLMGCASNNEAPEQIRLSVLKSLQNMELTTCVGRLMFEKSLAIVMARDSSTALRSAASDLILRFDKELFLQSDENSPFQNYVTQRVRDLLDDQETDNRTKQILEKLLESLNGRDKTFPRSFMDRLFEKFHFGPHIQEIASKWTHFIKSIPTVKRWWKYFDSAFHAQFRAEGMEGIAITILKYLDEMDDGDRISELLEEIIAGFMRTDSMEFKLDDASMIFNIKQLVEKYRMLEPYLRPFFNIYLDAFGTSLVYITSEDFMKFLFQLPERNQLLELVHRGVFWNATRMVRLQEFHQQVPTLMGMPLRWTTHAVLGTSLKSFFKLTSRSDILLQPSFALTYVNRMVLDSFSRIGVQTNHSIYSSIRFMANLQLDQNKMTLTVEKPLEPKTILLSSQTKELLKMGGDEDFSTRESSSWCTPDYASSLFGMELCSEHSSFVQIPRSNRTLWQLSIGSTNKVKKYVVDVTKYPPSTNEKVLMGITTSGFNRSYELLFHMEAHGQQQMTYVTIPCIPEFIASMESDSFHHTLILKTDLYSLNYSNKEIYEEENTNVKTGRTRLLTVTTPDYSLQIKGTTREDILTELHLSFEDLVGSMKWPEWWDASTGKAWIELHFIRKEEGRTVLFKIPASTIEISRKTTENEGMVISMTKIESNTGRVLGYFNFSRSNWVSKTKEAVVWSVTIPRKSWSLYWHKMSTDSGLQYLIELKRAFMTPKSSLTNLRWDICDTFDKREENILDAVVDLDFPLLNSEVVQVKASFHSGPLSVVSKGRIMMDGEQTSYRFQENFEVESNLIDLKLATHSVYEAGMDDTSFHHKTVLFHVPSQKDLTNSMEYRHSLTGCQEFSWKHDIRSHFFDSLTRASQSCDATDLKTLKLHWKTNSNYWKTLNMRVDQIFKDIDLGRTIETCNISFSKSVVNVTAEWNDGDHQKTASRTCMSEDCRNIKFFMKYLHNGEFLINVDLPGAGKFSFARTASNIKLQLEDEKDGIPESIELSGDIHRNAWSVEISPKTFLKVKSLLDSAYREIELQFMNTINDPQHPLQPIYSYLQKSKQKMEEFIYPPVGEIVGTLQAILPIDQLSRAGRNVYNFMKGNSLTTWAIHTIHTFDYPKKDGNYIFKFSTGRMLSSFTELISLRPLDSSQQPVAKIEMASDSLQICTFDGLSYKFLPSNSFFLLAYDLKTSLFSVITSGKTLHVLFPEMTITINHRNQVIINGNEAETPTQFKNVRVTPMESGVDIRSPSIRVKCKNDEHFICKFELDDWHSTFGLLGNADGQWENDYMLPDGNISSDILEFICNYKVSGGKECKDFLSPTLHTKSSCN